MSAKKIVALVMSVRDEESIIDLNISYNLDLGFDYIFITDHHSVDKTSKILDEYKNDPRVIVTQENGLGFDHAKIVNKLLKFANNNFKIDWFFFFDADEFLSIKDKTVGDLVERMEKNNISYATIGWANALFDSSLTDYSCSAVHPIDTTKFYLPWPEKNWQENGHFRKAIVKNHSDIEVVAGGHYVRTENNRAFFGDFHWNPFIVPQGEARLLHFEFRDKAVALYEKWKKLAAFENDSTSPRSAPWLERIQTIKGYVRKYKNNLELLDRRWFYEHRSFWGTLIPDERIVYDASLSAWYGQYFRNKIESGIVKSVCLVRSGHLGDVIMSEPVARYLSQFVPNVYLATREKNVTSLLKTYKKIYDFDQLRLGAIDCDLLIKLVYERSDNNKTYIEGYMESIGYPEEKVPPTPLVNCIGKSIIDGEYMLLAPATSGWEEKKRKWKYEKFIQLATKLERYFSVKCVLLGGHHSFDDMVLLIKHCKFFVGNDSGPGVLAQCFNKKAYIIYGATRPGYAQLSTNVVPIFDKYRHKLCQHSLRSEEVECCEEFCMDRLTVETVYEQITANQ